MLFSCKTDGAWFSDAGDGWKHIEVVVVWKWWWCWLCVSYGEGGAV